MMPLQRLTKYNEIRDKTIEEKEKFLKQCIDNDYILFLEHDAQYELASLKMTEKGIRLDKTFSFNELFGY